MAATFVESDSVSASGGCLGFLHALPAAQLDEHDCMDDGISTKIILRCAGFTGFQRKRALIFRCGLSRTGNCQPDSSVSLTVSLVLDRVKAPSPHGFSPSVDNRVGVEARDFPI